jgi:hypothetical protein
MIERIAYVLAIVALLLLISMIHFCSHHHQ